MFLTQEMFLYVVNRCDLGLKVHSVPGGAGQVAVTSITVVVRQGKAVVVEPVSHQETSEGL